MSGALPIPILAFAEIDSTNAEARRRADAGAVEPVWITAKRQTAGRGRRGRPWSTEIGNLAATLLTFTDKPPVEAAQVAFVAALAIADLFDAYVPANLVTIKWPNDVLIDGLKASGILIESGSRADGSLWLAIGCGLNLNHAPINTERPATRVADHLRHDVVRAPKVDEAMAAFAPLFAARLEQWERQGFAAVAADWTRRADSLGKPCTARLGTETVYGIAEGLEPDGALRLRLDTGETRKITAGDVFFETA
ncbi:MAG TPA: biotin--[acetyl-CoA-carboxylase] ligase [Caulobacteraceae bacterium]|jgi:BirA family biotin operon repressor/biotin-[acetyl-CoA-carboxylase] ligase|nr:biotin--[acetyl-CoA-carboxylase] ligase [Caulobacteraceae bacterium]